MRGGYDHFKLKFKVCADDSKPVSRMLTQGFGVGLGLRLWEGDLTN